MALTLANRLLNYDQSSGNSTSTSNPTWNHGVKNKKMIFQGSNDIIRIFESTPVDRMIEKDGYYKSLFLAFLFFDKSIKIVFNSSNPKEELLEELRKESPTIYRILQQKKSAREHNVTDEYKSLDIRLANTKISNDILASFEINDFNLLDRNNLDVITGDDFYASITYSKNFEHLDLSENYNIEIPKKATLLTRDPIIKTFNDCFDKNFDKLESLY